MLVDWAGTAVVLGKVEIAVSVDCFGDCFGEMTLEIINIITIMLRSTLPSKRLKNNRHLLMIRILTLHIPNPRPLIKMPSKTIPTSQISTVT